ncbi:MAG: carboxy terminal-processing peptidase [Cyclobacteriaceae bacterium]
MNKKATLILLILTVVFATASSGTAKEDSVIVLKPKPKYQLEVNYIRQLLGGVHYRKVALSDSLSRVIFDNYIESLDYNKTYFYSSDIDYFSKYREQMDNDLNRGNVDVGFQIYRIFRDRANKRLKYAYELLDKGFDYEKVEALEIDSEKREWAKNDTELDERWRKIVKSQALGLKLSGKNDSTVNALLKKRYRRYQKNINQNNSDDVFELFLNSYTRTLDPHTTYMSPPSSQQFNIGVSKALEGIGARLTQDNDYTVIDAKITGGPAFKSEEILVDDKIIGVAQGDDGEFVDIIGWRLSDVVQLIRGPKGSIVRLQLIRDGVSIASPLVVSLERDKINLDDQKAKAEIIPISEGGQKFNLGVITVHDFYRDFDNQRNGAKEFNSVTKDVKALIDKLKSQEMDGLLIDLRNNGGGSLEEAIDMSGLFIEDGPVVQVKNSRDEIAVRKDQDKSVYYDGPLAVLTNRRSASASEIFSGAIQDYKRGVILGESTFGKGTVQTVVSLNRQMPNYPDKLGNLKLTIQMFYRITGSSTQNIGVSADIPFPTAFDPEDYGESSYPSSLPWHKINPSDYTTVNAISDDLIERLSQLYEHHLDTDEDLKKLQEDVEKLRKRRDQESISLNYSERKEEQEKDSPKETVQGNSIENSELKEEKEFAAEEKHEKKFKKDPYLKESLRLLAEIIRYKVG